MLRANGASQVIIDGGARAGAVRAAVREGFDEVLELVGVITLADSLQCAKRGGIVCITGLVGDKWTFENLTPMEIIPKAVCLTTASCRPKRSAIGSSCAAAAARALPGVDLLERAHDFPEDGPILVITDGYCESSRHAAVLRSCCRKRERSGSPPARRSSVSPHSGFPIDGGFRRASGATAAGRSEAVFGELRSVRSRSWQIPES